MARIYEEISKGNANGGGRPDANLAQDANNLGGVPAEEYATKKYVRDYHDNKETAQKEYIDQQDAKVLEEAKEYTNSQIRNQDFSAFAKTTDIQAVDEKLTKKIEECGQHCAENLNTQITAVVDDTNANFKDVNDAIGKLNANQNNLFQSVSDGKQKIAGAITDKGVATSANDSYDTMAGNIRSIQTGGGELAEGFVNTSDGTATASDILLGKTAYVKGEKLYGGLVYPETEDSSDATATPYDILQGKTAYVQGRKIQGILNVDENSKPSYDIGSVEKIYGTVTGDLIKSTVAVNKYNYSSSMMLNCAFIKKSDSNELLGYVRAKDKDTIETALFEPSLGTFVNLKTFTAQELGMDTSFDKLKNIYATDEYVLFTIYQTGEHYDYVYEINIGHEQIEGDKYKQFLEIDYGHKWRTKAMKDGYSYSKCIAATFSNITNGVIALLYSGSDGYILKILRLKNISKDLAIDGFGEFYWDRTAFKTPPFQSVSSENTIMRFLNGDSIIEINKPSSYFDHNSQQQTMFVVLNNYNAIKATAWDTEKIANPNIIVVNNTVTKAVAIKGKLNQEATISKYDVNINYATGDITFTKTEERITSINSTSNIDVTQELPLIFCVTDDTKTNGLALFSPTYHSGDSDYWGVYLKFKLDFDSENIIIFDEEPQEESYTFRRRGMGFVRYNWRWQMYIYL